VRARLARPRQALALPGAVRPEPGLGGLRVFFLILNKIKIFVGAGQRSRPRPAGREPGLPSPFGFLFLFLFFIFIFIFSQLLGQPEGFVCWMHPFGT
jgi:hypothetical protein